MYKIIDLGSEFEATGEPRVRLLDRNLIKTASTEIQDFWDRIVPSDDKSYLWVIGVSAWEYYGCNRNGDAFHEAELKKTHQRFVETAHIFLQHVNRDPAKSIGKPIYSWYNDDMHRVELILEINKNANGAAAIVDKINNGDSIFVSMGCFPAGTPVRLANGKDIAIEEVQSGYSVISHTGNARKVKTCMELPYTGKLYNICYSGHTGCLRATEEHPILVYRYTELPKHTIGDCPVCGKHIKDVLIHLQRKKDTEHASFYSNIVASKFNYEKLWVKAKDLRVGDYVATPIITSDTRDTYSTKDLAFSKLLGYFIAEGSYIKYKGRPIAVQFNFHSNETKLHTDLLECISTISDVKPSKQIREKMHLCVISLYDKDLANKVYSLVGEYSHSKYISGEIFNFSNEEKLCILSKYIDGDGTYSKIHNLLSYTTISKDLAYSLEQLAASLGITIHTSIIHRNDRKFARYTGEIISGISILSKYCDKFSNYIEKPRINSILRPSTILEDNKLLRKITSIEIEDVTELQVYNLAVEEDESYIAENIAVHNCNVAYDVCSICGNKAPSRKEYCDHLRYNMKKILPDGRQVFAFNPNPKFFDISIVRKPADPTAFTLDKIASEGGPYNYDYTGPSSAELGEQSLSLQEKVAALSKLSDIVKSVDGIVVDSKNTEKKPEEPDMYHKGFLDALRMLMNTGFGGDFDKCVPDYSEFDRSGLSPAGLACTLLDNECPMSFGDAAWMAAKRFLSPTPLPSMIGRLINMIPTALDALRQYPEHLEDATKDVFSCYNGELENPVSRGMVIRVTKPIIRARITIVKKLTPFSKFGAFNVPPPIPKRNYGRNDLEYFYNRLGNTTANFEPIHFTDKYGNTIKTTAFELNGGLESSRVTRLSKNALALLLGLGAAAFACSGQSAIAKAIGIASTALPALALWSNTDPTVIKSHEGDEVPMETVMGSFHKNASIIDPVLLAVDYGILKSKLKK